MPMAFGALVLITASFTAHATTSTQSVADDPIGGYWAMKSALKGVYENSGWPDHSDGKLLPCGGIGMRTSLPPFDDGNSADFMEVWAQVTLMIERKLRGARYPASVWKQLLAKFEQSVLDRIADTPAGERHSITFETALGSGGDDWHQNPHLVALLESLADYHRAHPELEDIGEGGECGDGDITMKLDVSPPGARTWFLVEFHYRLCKAQGIDALDVDKCDRWVEATTDVIALAGNYRYLAVWPDGTRRSGLLRFNGEQFDGKTIHIRR